MTKRKLIRIYLLAA